MACRSLLMAWFSVVAVAACSSPQQATVTISDAWSPVAPPGAAVVAVYGQISAGHDDVLIGVSTTVADSAELHATTSEGGMTKMRPVARLEIGSGQVVRLEPGGMHLMLTGVRQSFPAGSSIPLTFRFERAGDITAVALVR